MRPCRWNSRVLVVVGLVLLLCQGIVFRPTGRSLLDYALMGDKGTAVAVTAAAAAAAAAAINNNTTNRSTIVESLSKTTKPLTFANDLQHVPTLPRWGPNNDQPINVSTLYEYAHYALSLGAANEDLENSNSTTTHQQQQQQHHHIPSSIYLVDSNYAIWTNNNAIRRQDNRARKRRKPIERLAVTALELMYQSVQKGEDVSMWPHLQEQIESKGGFLFMIYYRDFVGCNRHNYHPSHGRPKASVPVFTMCAHLNCDYAFPFPTYNSIANAGKSTEEWDRRMQEAAIDFAKEPKIPKAVWRGSLTGARHMEPSRGIRWRLAKMSHQYPDLLDAKLVQIPKTEHFESLDLSEIGGIGNRMPMVDFQKYTAIIDCDGNAWSSRFAELICMDSVVIKFQPKMVDHFWFNDLQAWKHYIPVSIPDTGNETADDLILEENVLSAVQWVLGHPKETQEIVYQANDWCADRMTVWSLGHDALDIFDAYVSKWDVEDELATTLWADFLDRKAHPSYHMTRLKTLFPGEKAAKE